MKMRTVLNLPGRDESSRHTANCAAKIANPLNSLTCPFCGNSLLNV